MEYQFPPWVQRKGCAPRRDPHKRLVAALAVIAVSIGVAACNSDKSVTSTKDETVRSIDAKPASNDQGDVEYHSVSDVASHAAIGGDISRVKGLLAEAKENRPVDWVAVNAVYAGGGASVKGDGSVRTLAGLVDLPETHVWIADAIAGTGSAQGASDPVRAQHVDKGISVLLAAKVSAELDAAREKVGNTDKAEGAPHNVDEAWAFFTAGGNGLAATADKRATDFGLVGRVREPVLVALGAAQSAALAGDGSALHEAIKRTGDALAYIFYLATYKYLGAGDEVGRAEGLTFYGGIRSRIAQSHPDADALIVEAFGTGDGQGGRSALNRPDVLNALAIQPDEAVQG